MKASPATDCPLSKATARANGSPAHNSTPTAQGRQPPIEQGQIHKASHDLALEAQQTAQSRDMAATAYDGRIAANSACFATAHQSL